MAIVANIGRVIVIGLEEKNLEKLRAGEPFHQYLEDKLGIPHDLVIFYGKTMDDLIKTAEQMRGPGTVVTDHRNRRKS
jgi:hypothetical protein